MNIVKFFDGKKTITGAVVTFVAGGLYTVGLIDQNLFDQIMKYNLIILGVGLADKVRKAM